MARNDNYVTQFMDEKNVKYLGAVTRERLVKEQLAAQIHYYPCTYEELFCIAVAESQVAGVLPITTTKGALETTNMGVLIDGRGEDQATQQVFIEKTLEYLNKPDLTRIQNELRQKALERFDLNRILKEWDERVFR